MRLGECRCWHSKSNVYTGTEAGLQAKERSTASRNQIPLFLMCAQRRRERGEKSSRNCAVLTDCSAWNTKEKRIPDFNAQEGVHAEYVAPGGAWKFSWVEFYKYAAPDGAWKYFWFGFYKDVALMAGLAGGARIGVGNPNFTFEI